VPRIWQANTQASLPVKPEMLWKNRLRH